VIRGAALLVTAALLLTGCTGDGDPVSTESPSPTPPGQQAPSTWQPTPPAFPVDEGDVTETYAAALAAAADAVPDGLAWSDARATTELFAGVCVVKVERVGTGTLSSDVDALESALAAAVAGQGFDDLTSANDPGGALLFVAHDEDDALFEFRSKGTTTVAVRVATSESECG
jgi:hypothetical protein